MTQQGDARNPTQADQSSFVFRGNASSRGSSYSSGSDTVWDRWPLLQSIRQIVTAFVLEAVTNTQPLREKWVLFLWAQYLRLIEAYPLSTIFLSSFLFFSAGPVLVFACVTGVSLGILVSIAAISVLIVQAIIVSIAGGVLLLVLGGIFLLSLIGFLWAVAAFMSFKLLRNVAKTLQEQRRHRHREQMRQEQSQRSTARAEKAAAAAASGADAEDDEFAELDM